MVRNQTYSNVSPILIAGGGGVSLLALLKQTTTYPSCIGGKYNKDACNEARYECKVKDNEKWLRGGKECWVENFPSEPVADESAQDTAEQKLGLSKGAKIGIAVGGVAVLGIALYFLMRKK